MPLHHFRSTLRRIDAELQGAAPSDVPNILLPISTDLFGILLWRRDQLSDYPNLQALLPSLPSPEIQRQFAGASGEALLPMACSFMNYFEKMTALHLRVPMKYAQVIDYGCGWGRLSRFLIKYTPTTNIRTLDPDANVLQCFNGSVLESAARVIPRHPGNGIGERTADVAFLFSILTHTPPSVTAELSAWLTQVLAPAGLLLFTIRPRSYWNHHANYLPGYSADVLSRRHDEEGFAYMGHGVGNDEYGDVTYADEYILSFFPSFQVIDRTFVITDPLQTYYTLKRS